MDTNLDLSQYPNSAGWEIVLDGDALLYDIVNKEGVKMEGRWTNYAFAVSHLAEYLEKMKETAGPGRGHKKENDMPLEQEGNSMPEMEDSVESTEAVEAEEDAPEVDGDEVEEEKVEDTDEE